MDLSRDPAGRVVLLTGDRDSGKTTACLRLVGRARAEGLDCAGLLSPACFLGPVRIGSDVLDIRSGERRRLASLSSNDPPPDDDRVRYRIDAAGADWAAARLAGACPCDLLVVDEIGPLELERGGGFVEAIEIARRGDFGLAVLVARPRLVPALLAALEGCRGPGGGDPTVLSPANLADPVFVGRLVEQAHASVLSPR